jgi:hypothetical protein
VPEKPPQCSYWPPVRIVPRFNFFEPAALLYSEKDTTDAGEQTMTERRRRQRRCHNCTIQMPLYDRAESRLTDERRRRPTRRINDIAVKEISCSDFIAWLNL